MDREAVHVVYASDARGALALAASACSVAQHLSSERQLSLWVLCDGISSSDRARIERSVSNVRVGTQVTFLHVPSGVFNGLRRSKHIPRTAYARLLMENVLPIDVQRCIYLDIDTVCLTDISVLFDTPLGLKLAGCVVDGSDRAAGRREFERLGVDGELYFNSGVMLCDLANWRRARVGENALSFAREDWGRLRGLDQDALNVVLRDKWLELPEKWNRWASSENELSDCVVHYTMTPKPWDADFKGRGLDLFLRALGQTEFMSQHLLRKGTVQKFFVSMLRRLPYPPTVVRMILTSFRR